MLCFCLFVATDAAHCVWQVSLRIICLNWIGEGRWPCFQWSVSFHLESNDLIILFSAYSGCDLSHQALQHTSYICSLFIPAVHDFAWDWFLICSVKAKFVLCQVLKKSVWWWAGFVQAYVQKAASTSAFVFVKALVIHTDREKITLKAVVYQSFWKKFSSFWIPVFKKWNACVSCFKRKYVFCSKACCIVLGVFYSFFFFLGSAVRPSCGLWRRSVWSHNEENLCRWKDFSPYVPSMQSTFSWACLCCKRRICSVRNNL